MNKQVVRAQVVMPPKAAAYLDIAHMRKDIFLLMFERHGNVHEAVEAAYVAMAFIEDGKATDMKNEPESTRPSKPAALPVDEASAPGNAGKALAVSGAERARDDQEPCPATEGHTQQATAGAGEQSGSPATEDLVRIGLKNYSRGQLETFKQLWADPNTTCSALINVLGVSWTTVLNVASRLNLAPRGNRAQQALMAEAPRTHQPVPRITLDQAIDWYENLEDGKPVIPSEKYPGSFQLGESGAVITRNALVAEINATRLRKGQAAFCINLNGA